MRILAALLAVLALSAATLADDTLMVSDRAAKPEKVVSLLGTITAESVAGIKLKPNVGPEKEIAAGDIVDVIYEVRPAAKLMYNSALQNEKKTGADAAKALTEAQKDYAGVAAQLDEKPAKLRRHIQYKLAPLKLAKPGEHKVKQLQAADL